MSVQFRPPPQVLRIEESQLGHNRANYIMEFNFPENYTTKMVGVKFKPDMLTTLDAISRQEECTRTATIHILLDGAIKEYLRQNTLDIPEEKEPLKRQVKVKPYSDDKCAKCGMSLTGNLSERRSKIMPSVCDSCDGSSVAVV